MTPLNLTPFLAKDLRRLGMDQEAHELQREELCPYEALGRVAELRACTSMDCLKREALKVIDTYLPPAEDLEGAEREALGTLDLQSNPYLKGRQ